MRNIDEAQIRVRDQWSGFKPVTFEGLKLMNGVAKGAIRYGCLESCSQPHTSLNPLHHPLKSFHGFSGAPILWSVNTTMPSASSPLPLVFLTPISGMSTLNSWSPPLLKLAFSTSTSSLPTVEVPNHEVITDSLFSLTLHLQPSRKSSGFLHDSEQKNKDFRATHKVLHDLDPQIVTLVLLSLTLFQPHWPPCCCPRLRIQRWTSGPFYWLFILSETLFSHFPTYPQDSFSSCP